MTRFSTWRASIPMLKPLITQFRIVRLRIGLDHVPIALIAEPVWPAELIETPSIVTLSAVTVIGPERVMGRITPEDGGGSAPTGGCDGVGPAASSTGTGAKEPTGVIHSPRMTAATP